MLYCCYVPFCSLYFLSMGSFSWTNWRERQIFLAWEKKKFKGNIWTTTNVLSLTCFLWHAHISNSPNIFFCIFLLLLVMYKKLSSVMLLVFCKMLLLSLSIYHFFPRCTFCTMHDFYVHIFSQMIDLLEWLLWFLLFQIQFFAEKNNFGIFFIIFSWKTFFLFQS